MYQVKRVSQLQERNVAKEVGGRTVIASGALWASKADVRSEDFLFECKTTEKDYYSLHCSTWNKIFTEATKDSLRIPAMVIDLCGGKYRVAVVQASLVNCEISQYNKTKKSFRIRYSDKPYQIIFEDLVLPSKSRVVVVPWDYFLNEINL